MRLQTLRKLQRLRKLPIAIFATFLTFLTFLTFPTFAEDKIVAVVNNEVITQKDLNEFLAFTRMELSTEYKGRELETKIQTMKLDLLERLIEDRLILQEAKKSNININQERIKARLEEIKKNYRSETDFQNAIVKQGITQADIENKIREQFLMFSIIEEKIKNKIVINPNEITAFYEKNSGQFSTPQERTFEFLGFTSETDARQAYMELKRQTLTTKEVSEKFGASFNQITAKGSGQLKKEIEGSVFALEPGEISQPVKIGDNFYVFKLDSISASRKLSLPEVQERISSLLLETKMQEKMAKWLDELKKNSYIKIAQ